jgi:hypothetical protein
LRWFIVAPQNAELFTLTYGAIVRQLLTDLEEVEEVNKQLDQMYAPPSSLPQFIPPPSSIVLLVI